MKTQKEQSTRAKKTYAVCRFVTEKAKAERLTDEERDFLRAVLIKNGLPKSERQLLIG